MTNTAEAMRFISNNAKRDNAMKEDQALRDLSNWLLEDIQKIAEKGLDQLSVYETLHHIRPKYTDRPNRPYYSCHECDLDKYFPFIKEKLEDLGFKVFRNKDHDRWGTNFNDIIIGW